MLSLFAAALLSELALRLFAPQDMSFGRFYALDDTLPWTLRPSHQEQIVTGEYSIQINIDPLGCRLTGASPRDDNTSAVLVLGDSFMFGNGVLDGEVMAARIQAILQCAPPADTNYHVVNAGVPGYGPLQYKLRYEQLRSLLRPTIVIIGLYLGNDIFDCLWDKSSHTVVDGYLVSRERADASAVRFWMKRSLHMYRLVSRVSQQLRARSGSAGYSYHRNLAGLFVDGEANADTPAVRAWTRFEAVVEELLSSIQTDGVEPLVVILPMRIQVDDALWESYAARIAAPKTRVRRFLPQEKTVALLDRLNVEYVDLAPAFIEAGGAKLFYALDGHWNAKGHRLAAAIAAEYVQKLLMQ